MLAAVEERERGRDLGFIVLTKLAGKELGVSQSVSPSFQ